MAADQPTQEQWRPVPGYEGMYEVSDHGRVRSLDRICTGSNGKTRRRKGKALRPCFSKYWNVRLSREGVVKFHTIHSLVAAAFIGPRPEGMHVCHNDGDRNNNSASNLRYDTPSGNQLDTLLHGTNHHANKTHCPRGHEYTPENTARFPSNPRGRHCWTCIDIHNQALIAAKRRRAATKET